MMKKILAIVLIVTGLLTSGIMQPSAAKAVSNYTFDGMMTQEVMENYLSKSVHIMDLCNNYQNVDKRNEWLRFISNTGAKFIGRAAMIWSDFDRDEIMFSDAVGMAAAVHSQDAEIILQAAIFETTATTVNNIAIPSWVFTEFGLTTETRNFNYNTMLYDDGRYVNQWGTGISVPDITKLETQMFFYYRAKRFIDAGYEAIHFGQVNLMGELDPFYCNWNSLFKRIRNYASINARRHNILIDAHSNNVFNNCDPLWYSAKGLFRYETDNIQNFYNGDNSRLNRMDGPQTEDGYYIVYKASNLSSFEILSANGAHYGDIPKAYNIYTSPNGIDWTNCEYNSVQIYRNDYNWPNFRMTNQSQIPAETNYIKISWKVLAEPWLAQLMDVKINAGSVIIQDTLNEPNPAVKKLGLDFIGYATRMKAKIGYPQETYLELDYLDSFYGKTIGGINPQGFTCTRSPYLIELDNYGGNNGNPEVDVPYWPWGYDEIAWFDQQSDSYRNSWLQYAYDWIRTNDPAGHLQLPGFRCTGPTTFYSAITPSATFPNGRGDETTIKRIFANLSPILPNKVINSGFESGAIPWSLGTHWSLASNDKKSGSYSAKVVGNGDACSLNQSVAVTPNTNYIFSFYAKCGASSTYKVLSGDWVTNITGDLQTTANNAWTLYTVAFNSGSNSTVNIYVADNGTNSFTSYYDDFEVVPNKVVNPGFESGISPWSIGTHWSLASNERKSGAYSAKVVGNGDACSLNQSVAVTPNTNYIFSFYAKCGASSTYKVLSGDWATNITGDLQTTANNTWTLYTVAFNSGSNSTVNIYVADNGSESFTSYYDDFVIK